MEYTISAEQAKNIPLRTFFDAMGPRLDPEKAKDKLIKVGFNITDQNTTYSVVIRNQIAEISTSYDDSYDIIVSVDSDTWKGMVLNTINPLTAFASGKITVKGNQLQFIEFSNMFLN